MDTTLGFAALTVAIVCTGWGVSERLWVRLDGSSALDQSTPLERLTAAGVIGAMLWLGVNWILALTHALTRPTLLGAAAAFFIAMLVLMRGRWRVPRVDPFTLLVCLPIVLWIAYVLWRGVVLPPDNHDALAYHLPKAAFIAQAHGYGYFVTGDPRVTLLPANYELLLSDVLILTGTDHLTEWLSAIFYCLFLVAAGAVTQRWFGPGRHVVAAVMATAACPILLLHSGADKNDLIAGFFGIAALMWAARWIVHGGRNPLALTIVSLALAGGTKAYAVDLLVGLAPFVIVHVVRLVRQDRFAWREVALTAATALAAFLLGGGAVYLFDLAHSRAASAIGPTQNFLSGYGDWATIWQFPYLVLAEPFSRNPSAVWVPWRHEYWFWPRYEIFFSSFGPLFSILVCLIPFCLFELRKRISPAAQRERAIFCIAAAIAVVAIMPLEVRPIGFFGQFARYVAFVIPAVIGCSITPIAEALRSRVAATRALIATLSLYFVWQAVLCGYNDRFSPYGYARWAARHPGSRVMWFNPWSAGSVIDRLAGPNDTVAVDSGFDTWLYPAMGEWHTRRLEFIAPGTVAIPDDAQWVMVDKSWNVIWGNPALTDLGKFWGNVERGAATAEDTRVIRALRDDSRFALVYYDARHNQAVFRRKR